MYTPPLWFTGVNILVRFKSHGLFPGNGYILDLLALGVYIMVVVLCLCPMWMSYLKEKRANLPTHTREFRPTIHLPSRSAEDRKRGGNVVVGVGKKGS